MNMSRFLQSFRKSVRQEESTINESNAQQLGEKADFKVINTGTGARISSREILNDEDKGTEFKARTSLEDVVKEKQKSLGRSKTSFEKSSYQSQEESAALSWDEMREKLAKKDGNGSLDEKQEKKDAIFHLSCNEKGLFRRSFRRSKSSGTFSLTGLDLEDDEEGHVRQETVDSIDNSTKAVRGPGKPTRRGSVSRIIQSIASFFQPEPAFKLTRTLSQVSISRPLSQRDQFARHYTSDDEDNI